MRKAISGSEVGAALAGLCVKRPRCRCRSPCGHSQRASPGPLGNVASTTGIGCCHNKLLKLASARLRLRVDREHARNGEHVAARHCVCARIDRKGRGAVGDARRSVREVRRVPCARGERRDRLAHIQLAVTKDVVRHHTFAELLRSGAGRVEQALETIDQRRVGVRLKKANNEPLALHLWEAKNNGPFNYVYFIKNLNIDLIN